MKSVAPSMNVKMSVARKSSLEDARTQSDFAVDGRATPVSVPGVPTIADSLPVTFLTPPDPGEVVQLEAPTGMVRPGAAFCVRYLSNGGAVRAIFRCIATTPRPGMREILVTEMVTQPGSAVERAAFRTALRMSVNAKVVRATASPGGKEMPIELLDVSSTGIGFLAPQSSLMAGDVLEVAIGASGQGVRYEIVWGDRNGQGRFGARASDPHGGALACTSVLQQSRQRSSESRKRALQRALALEAETAAAKAQEASGNAASPDAKRMWTR
jgi:hypothetical protein